MPRTIERQVKNWRLRQRRHGPLPVPGRGATIPVDRAYFEAFALTLAIELPIYVLILTWQYQVRPLCALGLGTCANLATHPIVWFVLYPYLAPTLGGLGYIVVAELFAWWLEAILLWAVLRRRFRGLLALSLLANSASYLIGTRIIRP